jgi:hypothetical protein
MPDYNQKIIKDYDNEDQQLSNKGLCYILYV